MRLSLLRGGMAGPLSLLLLPGCFTWWITPDQQVDTSPFGGPDTEEDVDASDILSWTFEWEDDDLVHWAVETSDQVSSVGLELIQTGDQNWNCGPGKYVVCGVWDENHNFSYLDGDTWFLYLDRIEDPEDQNNGSTLFDPDTVGLTIRIYASGGDCLTAGDDPSYFDSVCP